MLGGSTLKQLGVRCFLLARFLARAGSSRQVPHARKLPLCVPAVGATHPGGALVEDTAVEVAVDGWLHAASQVAAAVLEAVLVDEQEAFEVLRESSIENRAFGMA